MNNVIDYIPGSTLLHKLNPVTKLALAAAIIIATFCAGSYVMLGALLALTLILAAYAHAFGRLLTIIKLMIPLVIIMFLLQGLFVRTGVPVFAYFTDDGIVAASKVCLRLVGVALPVVLMLSVTKLTDLANACVELLHIPYRYAFTFTTALRFVPVFSQEMNAIMEAQRARGIAYDTKNPFRKAKLILPLCVPLLVTSVGKTDATALAAEQRGFYLRTRESSFRRYPMKALDIAALLFNIVLIALGVIF